MEVLQDTYKDTKIGRIPKDWNTLKINQVADCYGGTTPSTVVEEYWNGDILWATPSDITKNKSEYLLNTSRKITEQGRASKNLRFVKKNGLLMTSRASIGFLNISNGDVVTNQGFINIECKDNFHYKFFYYWVLDNRKKLLSLSQGSTFLELYRKTFSKISIPTPPLPEQQKIAAILSTVDEQISTTDKIIEKSKELKKGLMQKLFSEGIGHTEFKDTKSGRIPKDWEVTMLSEIGIIKVGRDLNKGIYSSKFNEKYKVPVYSNAITDGGLYGFYSRSEYPPNSITITGRGNIGFAFQRDQEFGAIGRLIVIQPNSNVDYVFLTNYINHIVNFHIETSGIPQLTGVQASKYKVALPPLPEQQKIAAILSEADAKIEKEQTQKAQLEALKKGLMQQLLTGKKRVKV